MRYRLAPNAELGKCNRGWMLRTKRPLGMVRVNAGFVAALNAMEASGAPISDEKTLDAFERLAKAGYLQALPDEQADEGSLPSVSVVIPVKDRAAQLARCLESISKLDYPQDKVEVIVVDDGSVDETVQVAHRYGAKVLDSGGTGLGPAAARNRGAACAGGELLAFIDSDCLASERWLKDLVGVFSNAGVAAVGGKVRGIDTGSLLDRYEDAMSSLSLGERAISEAWGTDTFYLPSCNLLVKKKVFRAVGGFNEELHVGEDVDLTWRIRDCGSRLVYRPGGVVRHDHRTNLWPFMKRRFQYGTSEAVLTKLHQWRRKRIKANPTGLLVLGLLLYAWLATSPVAAALAGALFLNDLARAWMYRPCRNFGFVQISMARLRVLGALGYHLTRYSMRYFAVILWPLAVLFPGFGALWICLVASVCLLERRSRKCSGLLLPVFMVFHILETTSYGLGVLYGCWNGMDFRTYRLTLSAKPL